VVRMPAFGLAGPWRDRVGFAMTMEQVSGLAWMTGYPDGPPVTLLGPCDPVGAAHGTIAVLLALSRRARTGESATVEVPMVAGALNLAAEQVLEYSANGVLLRRDGNRGPVAAPQNLYVCADVPLPGEDARRVALAVADDQQWRALKRALGDPAWAADPTLDHAAGRRAAHEAVDRYLAEWCAARSADEVVTTLWPAGVPVAPVLTNGELAELPPFTTRTFLEHVEHPVTGLSLHTTYPVQLSAGPDRWHRRAAPMLGQDNDDVLVRVAGLGPDELAALAAAGVTRCTIDPGVPVARP
jgi:crotonobetainyl-CoA:carnitine CoA-transferase CaiB-like acyl-CoA transferase